MRLSRPHFYQQLRMKESPSGMRVSLQIQGAWEAPGRPRLRAEGPMTVAKTISGLRVRGFFWQIPGQP